MHELLGAAFRLFANKGYEATSVRELNRGLGISHGLTHLRIGSKAKLWRLAVKHTLDHSGRIVEKLFEDDAEPDDLARLRKGLVRLIEWFSENPELVRLINQEGGHDTERLTYLCDAVYPRFLNRLSLILDRLAKAGRIRNISAIAFASLIVYGAGGYFALMPMHEKLGEKTPKTPAQVRRHAEMVADLLVAGLMKPAEPESATARDRATVS